MVACEVQIPALEVCQGESRRLYMFAIDGKQLPRFTTVSRVKRQNGELDGYQRPEVLAHVAAIRSYIESANPMIPNAIVVAFDDRVRFESQEESSPSSQLTRTGHLVIPVDPTLPDEDKPGWIVDGQQRCAAIREAEVDRFPMCVTAFIAGSEGEQRTQFILVNSTKPLPKGLIYELLPSTVGPLPPALVRKRFPTLILERLNFDEDSPMFQMIKTPTAPSGIIKDNSVLRMLDHSLSDGCLYYHRDPETGGGNMEEMLALLKNYWRAVASIFDAAWGQTPRRSRLMHGVGIISLGYVMDAITDRYVARNQWPSEADFLTHLEPLREYCSWTSGVWKFGPESSRRWNELQNTTKDIRLLTNHLLARYQQSVIREV